MSIDLTDIVGRLAAAGSKAADDKIPGGLDKLLANGSSLAEKHLTGELEPLRKPALDALGELDHPDIKKAASRLSSVGLAWVVGLMGSGDKAEARRRFIETEATLAERLAFQAASGDHAAAAQQAAEESWDAIEAGLKRAGQIAIKALGMVILGALGV